MSLIVEGFRPAGTILAGPLEPYDENNVLSLHLHKFQFGGNKEMVEKRFA